MGTCHVLYGLIKEGSGVANHVLSKNGVFLKKVDSEIDSLTKTPYPNIGYSPTKFIEDAAREATFLKQNYIGTEHLLLALLADKACDAYEILVNLGVNPEKLRKDTLELLGFYDTNYYLTKDNAIYQNDKLMGWYAPQANTIDLIEQPVSIVELRRILDTIERKQND